MKNKIFGLFILLSIISSGLLVCTISDDNGSPSITGPINNGDDDDTTTNNVIDSTMYLRIPNILPVESGDTISISLSLFTDSTFTKTQVGEQIIVRSSTSGVYISDTSLVTNNLGTATFNFSYVLPTGTTEDNIALTFIYNGQSSNTSVTVSEEPTTLNQNFMVISASPYNIKADGSSQSTISVKIKNENFNPIVGETILFKTDAGDITASGVTNESGIANAKLTGEKRNDIANITAIMYSDTTKTAKIQVEFTGVKLSTSINPESIAPNGADSAIVTITLKDANEEEIYGERVYFTTTNLSSAVLTVLDSTTNTRGQARCVVKSTSTSATSDTIFIRSAGDSATAVVFYSDNIITITPNPTASFQANGIDTTVVTVKYTASNGITGITGATVNVSVTAGTIGDSAKTTYTGTTNTSGEIEFILNNPDFATTVIITATASYGGKVTSNKKDIYYKASSVARIVLEGTPEVIETDGDKCAIKATCYDAKDNKVSSETVSFRIIDGPGSGEYLDPPTSKTDISGTALSSLISGSETSKQQEVKLVASSFSGVTSDTLFLTIAGAPEYITIRKNIGEISDNGDGTYTKNLAALVTDINRNPVKDSTLVTFSSQIIGYWIYKKAVVIDTVKLELTIGDSAKLLPFEDLNNNFKWDEGENRTNLTLAPGFVDTIMINKSKIQKGYPLYRGEDLVWYEGDDTYNPGPQFYDINCNGRRDYDPSLWGYEAPEPYFTYLDSTYDSTNSIWVYETITSYADFNGNKSLDLVEPLVNPSDSIDYENTANGFIPGIGYPDFDWSNNDRPDPVTTVIIDKTVPTNNGVAPNFLTYGQSDALRIKLKVWAESKGVVSETPEVFTLPILESDAKYFDPFEGKLYK